MKNTRQIYKTYWKQLKLFIDDRGQDWTFPSFEGESEMVVKIGMPKLKVCLALIGADAKNPKNLIAAGFWLPDSKDSFDHLKANRMQIESKMGKLLEWDNIPGRKSSWVRVKTVMDLSNEKNWPSSFEWFAQNAEKIRDVCYNCLQSV
jgi:hypothetical protein